MPTRLASTMILVSLYGEEYTIAVAAESAALTLLNASSCGYPHFQVASLRVSLRRGLVICGKVPDETGAVLGHAEKGTQLSRISRFSRVLQRFNFLRSGGGTISEEYVPEELDAWLVEPAFHRIDGAARLVKSSERLIECCVVFVLVSAMNHDVVTNISYSGNIGYQRLDGMLENLCSVVDSNTEPLILGQPHVRGECI